MKGKPPFNYSRAPKEETPIECPACATPLDVLAVDAIIDSEDRYGYPITQRWCPECGATWLRKRMTAAAYARFYAESYRPLLSWYYGKPVNSETIRPEQRAYAERLAWVLAPWALAPRYDRNDTGALRQRGSRLLDVGGATGEVARVLGAALGLRAVTILDPAPTPDPAWGFETIRGLAEDGPLGEGWEAILLCQTIDHLLDPAAVLSKLRAALAPGGLFFVDAVDFAIKREWKIDHPHNFTERALLRLLDRAGWTVATVTRWNGHVGAVCTA